MNAITTNVLKASYASPAASAQDKAALRQNIRELVGQTFFGEIFKQMRSEMNPSNPFNGGRGAQTFRGQLDQLLINRWSSTDQFKVADAIAGRWIGDKSTQTTTAQE